MTGMLTWRRSEQPQETSWREERGDTRNVIVCAPNANYLFRVLGITEDKNNFKELLLPCDRAGLAQMKPAENWGDNSQDPN